MADILKSERPEGLLLQISQCISQCLRCWQHMEITRTDLAARNMNLNKNSGN